MIGKIFRAFSNDWKTFSGKKTCQTITTIFDNFLKRQLIGEKWRGEGLEGISEKGQEYCNGP